jgi:hypothetical protein
MYFSTYNHYDDYTKEYFILNNEQCWICLECSFYKNNEIISIKTFLSIDLSIDLSCKCDGKFHIKCLKKWIDKTDSCPICRKQIYKKKYIEFKPESPNNQNNDIFKYIILFVLCTVWIYNLINIICVCVLMQSLFRFLM